MTIRIFLILLSLFTIMPVTMADETVDEIADSMRLDQVVVTGTRTRKMLKDAPIQTRIITSEDIVKSDATNIMDLLQHELPGVEFAYAMNQQTVTFDGCGYSSHEPADKYEYVWLLRPECPHPP